MKPVLKDQLVPSSVTTRQAFENPHEGHISEGEVELEEKIDDEIDFPYRAGNEMFTSSNPRYRKHVEEDVTWCLPLL